MRYILILAAVIFAGCGDDSSEPSESYEERSARHFAEASDVCADKNANLVTGWPSCHLCAPPESLSKDGEFKCESAGVYGYWSVKRSERGTEDWHCVEDNYSATSTSLSDARSELCE